MKYSNMSIEELLKVNDECFDLYYCLGYKYYIDKQDELAIVNFKKALKFIPDDQVTLLLISIAYYSLCYSTYESNKSGDSVWIKEMLFYMDKYARLVWDDVLNDFHWYQGVLPIGKDHPEGNDAIIARFFFLWCATMTKGESITPILEILLRYNYTNAYLFAGYYYETDKYGAKNIDKAIECYEFAHKRGVTFATCPLGMLYHEKKLYDKAFKYIFDAATNYRGTNYKYTMSKALLDEIKDDAKCCYGAQFFMADLYEGLKTYINYDVPQNIIFAKSLYELARKNGKGAFGKDYVRFGLVYDCISDKDMKALLKKFYSSLPYPYACEKAIELGLKKEAEVIFNNILSGEDVLSIFDLCEAFPERKDEIEPVLNKFKVTKLKYPLWYPRIKKHREEIKAKEEKQKEDKRIKEEAEKLKRKEAAEKKEEELVVKRAEAKKKAENEYDNILSLVKENKISEVVSLMERNKGYLSKKFPVEYYIVKSMNKEDCPKFEVSSYNVLYKSDSNDKYKERLNKIIDIRARIEACISNGDKELDKKLRSDLVMLKDNWLESPCFLDFRKYVRNYVFTNLNNEEKKKCVLRLALVDPLMFDIQYYSTFFDKKDRVFIYKIGEAFRSVDCRYNLYAMQYKELGLFKKKEKEEIIEKMKRISSFSYPAYIWLVNHKIKHDVECYDKGRISFLKEHSADYVDLIIK